MNEINQEPVAVYMLIRQYVMGLAYCSENNGKRIMSVRKLAKLYDVSVSTVTKALEGLIEEGALITKHGMGTYINSSAKIPFANTAKSKQVGVIVSNGKLVHYDQYYLKLISAVFSILNENNSLVQLIRPLKLDETFADILGEIQLDGIVWINPSNIPPACIDAIDNASIPMVMVTNHLNEYVSRYSVTTDFFKAGKLAGCYLCKEGYSEILHLCNSYSGHTANTKNKTTELIKGLKGAYMECGLEIDDKYFLTGGEELLDKVEFMIDFDHSFSAIFVDGNFCIPICELLKKKNIQVPEDVVIVSMEDTYSMPADFNVIYVKSPLTQLGTKAGELIGQLIESGSTKPVKIEMDWEISKRF